MTLRLRNYITSRLGPSFIVCLSVCLSGCNSEHDYIFNEDNIYVMSNPSKSNQEHFLVKGGVAVIEFKSITGTSSSNEKVSGLKYSEHIWDQENWLSDEQLKKISSEVNAAAKQPILIHAENLNISASWLALHLRRFAGKSSEDALKVAKKVGITAGWEKKLVEKLKSSQTK